MLNESRVLSYIKTNLGHPFQFIEFTDEQILEKVREFVLREFSQYFPDVNTIGFNPNVEANKVPGKGNEFYITEPENLEILGVKNIYFPLGDYVMHGHPPMGPLSMGELANWALSAEVAGWVKQFSNWDYTFEFKTPNIVRISPSPMGSSDYLAIEYERIHPPDFSKIPNEFQILFCDLALAEIMIMLGRIRKKYSGGDGIATPFGTIPLQPEIFEEGKELKEKVLEKMTAGSMPNVIFDVG